MSELGKEDKEVKILYPPEEGENGRYIKVLCSNSECGFLSDIWISKNAWWLGPLAQCPYCNNHMFCDNSTVNVTINAKGSGAHSGTIGDRKKRMMKERNEKLAKTQWDNHEPIKVNEGSTLRNPTEGGPYDPNGPFAKKKSKPIYMVPKN